MRFRVTSVAGSDEGRRLNGVTVLMEDHLNAQLGAVDFGSSIDQFTMVIVSVYDDPNANEKWCQGHRRIATATHPLTGKLTRYLSIAAPVAPAEVVAAAPSALQQLVAAAIERALAAGPSRLPKGLDFAALGAAVGSALNPSGRSAA